MDVDDTKLDVARHFGATHTVNSTQLDPVEALRSLTEVFGRPQPLPRSM